MVKLPSYSSAPPLVSLPSLLVLSFVVLLTVSLLPLSGDSPIPICVVLLVSPSLALRMQLVWQHFERQMQLRERRRTVGCAPSETGQFADEYCTVSCTYAHGTKEGELEEISG